MNISDTDIERQKKLTPLKILAIIIVLAPFAIFMLVRLWPNPEGKIFSAVNRGDVETVNKLLDREPTVALKADKKGRKPLYYAAKKGKLEVVQVLVSKGANVNDRDEKGETALFIACVKGHNDVVKFLVERGADVNTKTEKGKTPLEMAKKGGHKEIIQMLESKGAK